MELTAEQIDQVFEGKKNQHDVFIDIYKLVYPDWDNIERIKGYPTVGKALSDYIWSEFMKFDTIHHPDVVSGGLWMNQGFSTSDKLGAWEVDLSTAKFYEKRRKRDDKS